VKAAIFRGEGVLSIEDRPTPELRSPTDVLVRVLACGICGTDLHILQVPQDHPCTPGTVLGHEFIGEVADVGGEVSSVAMGDRVAIRPILTCGSCRECLLGRPNHCLNITALGIWLDGGLAEFAVVPASACIPMSSATPIEIAALVEPLACVYNAARKAQLFPGDDVVIFGAGPIGLLFLALFKEAGARRVVVVEPTKMRADVAREMGAETVDPTAGDLPGDREAAAGRAPGGRRCCRHAARECRRRCRHGGAGDPLRPERARRHGCPPGRCDEEELTIIGSFVGQLAFPPPSL
jgi:threonine dehydrogenase-like Zn-dependent dehydrogenase